MPKVSIIVPIYNVEKYLDRCLESIVNQTFQDIEIICVNDCSPDNSKKIVEKYKKNYNQMIKVIENKQNYGLGKTREIGIENATGTYIMCVDSDDYVDKDWVEVYISAIESYDNLDMVIGGYCLHKNEKNKLSKKTASNKYALYMCVSACCKIYRRSFLIKNAISFGGIRRSEDIFWTIQIAINNPRYLIIDNVGYHYCINTSSITRINKKNNQTEEELDKLHNNIFHIIDFLSINQFQRDMIEYIFVSNTFAWLYFYNKKCGIDVMNKKYDYAVSNLKRYFPEFKKNPMLRIGKVKAGGFLCRNFVSVELILYKLGLGKMLYYIRAIL